jgi:hypothetical protein
MDTEAATNKVNEHINNGNESPTPGVWLASVLASETPSADRPDQLCLVAIDQNKVHKFQNGPIAASGTEDDITIVASFQRSSDLRRVVAALANASGMTTEETEAARPTRILQNELAFMEILIAHIKKATESDDEWAALRSGILSHKTPQPLAH